MTDRVNAFTVVLAKDIRVDDVEEVATALRMVKFVLDVKPHVADLQSHLAYARARQELGEKLWAILYPKDAKA